MAFCLDRSAPLERAVREAATAELARAMTWARSGKRGKAGAIRTHELRKSMKRLRALLKLMRNAMRRRQWRALDRELRDIARSLSGKRDSDVRAAMIAGLMTGADPPLRKALKKLAIASDSSRISPRPVVQSRPASGMPHRLGAISNKFAKLALTRPETALESGLARCYRKVNEARHAAEDEPSDDAFHELRKAIQVHYRQLQLVQSVAPIALKPRIKATRDLGQTLGREHDLAMLQAWLKAPETALQAPEAELVAGICRKEQRKLRRKALVASRELFARRSKAFARDVARGWHDLDRDSA